MTKTFSILLIGALAISLPAVAQQTPKVEPAAPTSPSTSQNPGPDVYGGYMIGVGDILDIRVTDEDAITGRYQVDPNGTIQLPLLTSAISAAGLTTFKLSQQLQNELKQQDILREPSVTVFIIRGMTQNATVLGAVMRPGIYDLEQPTTLLDVISRAGGLQPNAGKEVSITHRAQGSGAQDSQRTISQSVDLPALMSGHDLSSNFLVQAGDVITVTTAPVVFVVGAVVHPGAFTVQNSKAEMTVLQAIAMAEGILPTASQGHTVIVRQSSDKAQRQEIPIDLKDVIRGKQTDQILLANDILFIPQSGFKAGMRRVGDVAVQAASRVTAYGFYTGF